ncbi:MAG: EAL domain-containing protein [Rhodocyclaceae bacterium]|nr:EAL domain-containing protein [Rhodocyclaceae bacterium]
MTKKTPHTSASRNFWLTAALFLALLPVFGFYIHAEKRIDRAHEQHHAAFRLADELRHSSNELSRMAHSYVVTGDPLFKQYFQDILDIRDGRLPRPEGYDHAYWDRVLANPQALRTQDGPTIALLDLLRQTGVSEAEFARLAEAKARSDALTTLERAAMDLVTASGTLGKNRAEFWSAAERARARLMLYDENYHRAKDGIMQPINEFSVMMEQRGAATVRSAEDLAMLLRLLFIGTTLAAAFFLWRAYASLRRTLGGSVDEIHAQILRIGRGDFSSAITIAPGMENSVRAKLSEMQNKLHAQEIEQQRNEAALLSSTAHFNEAQRLAHVGSWTLDLANDELVWSDEVFRLFEIDKDRFGASYAAFLAVTHPDDRAAVNHAYTESLVARAPYEITHRLQMGDGRIKWVHERGTSDFDAAGEPLRSSGTVQDITERKLAEQELRIAAAAFESLEATIITDADNVILRVNAAFTTITGYTAAEAIGQTPALLKSGRHDADFYSDMWESIQRTGGWQGEVWDRKKNGEEYAKWLTITVVKDAAGAVTHYVGTHFDITERKLAEEKINKLAFFDPLTGLPNRTLLQDRLKQAMTTSARGANHGALLFIDIDNFKTLNDTLGHDMGDQLLKQVASRLAACVREGDTVARMGGDEFVVVLGGLSPREPEAVASSEAVAAKILATFRQPFQLGVLTHQSTASIGISLFSGQARPASIDDVMKQADLAMYRSKDAGRNTWRFFDQSMQAAAMNRAALETDLREAVQQQQFLLHYQAQVVGEGHLTGAEVLVRWQHPERGMIAPNDFIPLAEETGLILPLGAWVLETTCTQLALWATRPEMAHLTLAVNISARQIHQRDFVERVLEVLDRTGANPQRLKLELTESLLVDNVEEIIGKMFALRSRGVGFSLDDFGTGYSSLSYLKRLPLDQLKIDRSFVLDVLTDPNDAAIARTVVALAQNLGLNVIAEGVENAEQRDFLANAGCHAYQGYFFSRPLPIEGFEAFARRG